MKTSGLLDATQKNSLLNSLGKGQIRRFFSKNIPHIEALTKNKTAPPFSKFTARKQKEKAAIAAWSSRFDSGSIIYFQNLTGTFDFRIKVE